MKKSCSAIVILAATMSSSAFAQPQEWSMAIGGNGHYYEAILTDGGVTWSQAFDGAELRGGYLVTIGSAEENAFVFTLIDSPEYWEAHPQGNNMGPWLGGFQSPDAREPNDGWQWVNGEGGFAYSNWYPSEPNNYCGYMNICEDRLQFFGSGANGRSAYWNDIPGELNLVKAYVIEYNAAPVPEPASWMLWVGGIIILSRKFWVGKCAASIGLISAEFRYCK